MDRNSAESRSVITHRGPSPPSADQETVRVNPIHGAPNAGSSDVEGGVGGGGGGGGGLWGF